MSVTKEGSFVSMSNRRKGRAYRIIVILIAFVLIGAAVFIPLLMGSNRNDVLIYVLLGVYLAALVGTIVANEIIIYRRNKANRDE